MAHLPVLLDEAIKFLNLRKGSVALDATVDGGGHAEAIIEKILPGGEFIGIDQDLTMIEKLKERFGENKNTRFIAGNFRNADEILRAFNIRQVDAAFFDLGMSSIQLKESGRGFSFQKDEPLLMTFKAVPAPEDLTAEKILNSWPKDKIEKILREYGEERYWRRITETIVEERRKKRIKTTFELVGIIQKALRRRYGRIHPATKTFQALRIAVNDELDALKEGLEKVWNFISSGGRLAVISFHSLEDRIVKNFFKEEAKKETAIIVTRKPLTPSFEEKKMNPRSRSAKLRVLQKI